MFGSRRIRSALLPRRLRRRRGAALGFLALVAFDLLLYAILHLALLIACCLVLFPLLPLRRLLLAPLLALRIFLLAALLKLRLA